MRKIGILLLVILYLLCGGRASAQVDNPAMGTDFWCTFISPATYESVGYVVVSAPFGCNGLLTNDAANFSQSFVLQPGETTSISVPLQHATYSYGYGGEITGNQHVALHLVTTRPVMAFADDSFRPLLQDAAVLWPTSEWGSRYVVSGYATRDVRILSTEDSAQVAFYTAFALRSANPVPEFTATLNRGEVIAASPNIFDYEGGEVRVLNNKKVTVFCGNHMAMVPDQCEAFDQLYVQLRPPLPTGSYGYLLPRLPHEEYICRVVDMGGGSTLILRGDTANTVNLGRYGSMQFLVDSSCLAQQRSLTVVQGSVEVVMVTMGMQYLPNPVIGDPSMTLVSPFSKVGESDIPFRTLSSGSGASHYLVLCGTMAGVAEPISLDGQPLTGSLVYEGTGTDAHFYASLPLSVGRHLLHVPEGAKVGAYLTGVLNYGRYLTQLSLDRFHYSMDMQVNGLPYLDTVRLCVGEDVSVETQLVWPTNQMEWNINGVWQQGPNPYNTVMPDSVIMVGCRAGYHNDDEGSDTVVRWVVLSPLHASSEVLDVTSCTGQVINGEYFDSTCSRQYVLTNSEGCDSLLTVNFTLAPYEEKIDTGICPGFSLNWRGMTLRNQDTYTVSVSGDCDSLLSLTLELYPKPIARMELSESLVVNLGEPITVVDVSEGATHRDWWLSGAWVGNQEQESLLVPDHPARPEVKLVVGNDYGCQDSTSTLLQRDGGRIWAPNVIIAGQGQNGVFRIQSAGVLEMHVVIYNRQGQLIYEMDGLTEGWDGTCHGQPLPEGTYVWKARYRSQLMQEAWHEEKGTVTLLR